MLGKHKTEIRSEKSPEQVFEDVCTSMELVGKRKAVDREAGKVTGSCKFGAQTVRLTVQITPDEIGTVIAIQGSCDDVWGVAAKSGVRRLGEALENVDNEYFQSTERWTDSERASGWAAFPLLGVLVCVAAWYHHYKITRYEEHREWLSLWGPLMRLYEAGGKWAVVGTELGIAGIFFVCGIVMLIRWRRLLKKEKAAEEAKATNDDGD